MQDLFLFSNKVPYFSTFNKQDKHKLKLTQDKF